jgi:16S rRNA (cytosine1402-N4)-methyltransferase
MPFHHIPVLLPQALEALQIQPKGLYLDCTLGGGGHSEAILEYNDSAKLIGLDRDPEAIQAAQLRLSPFANRFQAVHDTYANYLSNSTETFNGILMDIGVSSHQLDTADRGFSFQHDGPLDMRMNPSKGITASEWLDDVSESELTSVLRKYGEEPRAKRISRAIIANRPWTRTSALADFIASASGYRNSRTHPATRSFQAIRIALNDELSQLESGIHSALSRLAPNGILAVISFHSLEDRLIKKALRKAAGYYTPKDIYGHPVHPPYGTLIYRKGLSGAEYDPTNPRARSARLRVFKRSSQSSSSPLIHLGV